MKTKIISQIISKVSAAILLLFSFQTTTVIAQLPLPYSENFDAAWTTLPTASWINTYGGNREWHRNDFTTGWTSGSGSYTPAGAATTANSARFHSYDASSGTTGELITPVLDFSPAGSKTLAFWYLNTSGTDKLQVFLSTDGGATWGSSLTTPATGIVVSASWTQYSINLGSSTSNNCKIKFTATSDWGTTDIGLDNIRVVVAVPMTFVSSTTTQLNTSAVSPGSTTQEIVGIQIVTTGSASPFNATGFTFNTTGSTAPATDIQNAKLWYTGGSSMFAATTQIGSAVASPNGVFTFTSTQTLSEGNNYFWLTYDIPSGAVLNNVVDAQCTQIVMSGAGGTQVPLATAPSGNRPIQPIYPMNNTPIITCGGIFTDDGGLTADYSLNANFTKTFTSADGTHLRFDFTSFSTETTWDWLKIYDGPTTASPFIGVYNGTSTLPPTLISSGTSMTFVFNSDGFTNKAGWSANISCMEIAPCASNPAADDNCLTATPISNLNGYCGNTSSSYLADSPGNLSSVFCVGSIDNNSWLSFVADSAAVELIVMVSGCTNGDGIQAAIYETSDCLNFNLVSTCWNPYYQTNGVITASGLTVGNQYYLLVDGFDGDDCDYTVGASEGIVVTLPIELSYFNAQCSNENIIISWQTATEENNDYFTIEKSTDLIQWQPAGIVNGAGNSNSLINYSFNDQADNSGSLYYRLKQTDYDGHFTYSQEVSVACTSLTVESIFPNPVENEIIITIQSKELQTVSINIIDELGRSIESRQNVSEGTSEVSIDVSQLAGGLYSLLITTEDGATVQNRFLKQ